MGKMPSDISIEWKSPEKEAEDQAALEKSEKKLKSLESRKTLFGGGKKHHGYMGSGVSDEEMKEASEDYANKKSFESSYQRHKEHR